MRGWAIASVAALLVGGLTAVGTPAAGAEDPRPLPWITTAGAGADRQLVDSSTDQKFVPRGNNYIRLAKLRDHEAWWHSTFEPGRYDAEQADAALAEMQRVGYNVVRVFLDPGSEQHRQLGERHGLGKGPDDTSVGTPAYLDNVADFVRMAAGHKIYVLPILDYYPQNAHYWGVRGHYDAVKLNVGGENTLWFVEGEIRAKEEYFTTFVSEMRKRLGPHLMSTFLALQAQNEAFYQGDARPFSAKSGTITPANGVTYDLAVDADRQQAADASAVAYVRRLAATVRASAEPKLLVTIGMFTFKAVNKEGPNGFQQFCSRDPGGVPCQVSVDYRYPFRPSSLAKWGELPFLDLHLYPFPGQFSLDDNLRSSEWAEIAGPVIIGEYGAFRDAFGNDIVKAAYGMRDLQADTCLRGADGWLFWTWDTEESADQQRLFRLTERDGAINGVLAPSVRPDPCAR